MVSLAISPDGRCFATASKNCDIALWDSHTGTHITTLEHAGDIYSLEFLADGQLASGNEHGELSLWDTVTGSRIQTVNAHSDTIYSLSASQSRLASGSWDKSVRVWDTATWESMCTFQCDGHIRSVALYPDGRVAACTSETVYVWNTATQQLIASKNISECLDVGVSNDGKWLAVGANKSISLYDASTSTLNCIWSYGRRGCSVSFSPDSSQLVSANDDDRKVSLIDVQTRSLVKSFEYDLVERAVFSHDGTHVLSGESCSVAL